MEQVNPQADEGTGMPVATITLKLSHLPSWERALKDFIETILRVLSGDGVSFDSRRTWGGASSDNPLGDADRGVIKVKSFPHGNVVKRLQITHLPDSRITVKVTYAIDGEDAELQQLALNLSEDMLERVLELVHKKLDRRFQVAVQTRLFGETGGMIFHDLLVDERRALPLVLVSEAATYPDGFLSWMEADLAKRAILTDLDEEASSHLTELFGKEWSCFNGSVRVYHPGWSEDDDDDTHPIWRRRQIILEDPDAEFAKRRFRSGVFDELFEKPKERDRKEIAALAEVNRELEQKNTGLADELSRTKDDLEMAREEIGGLEKMHDDLKGDIARRRKEIRDIRAKREDIPLRTVSAAVDWAMGMYGDKGKDTLVFEDRVGKGVDKLNPDAGPPEEVLYNLTMLHEYARKMRKGSLGDNAIAWFKDRWCDVSPESKGTLDEFKDRPWVKKGDPDWHMKPNSLQGAEGVRIHFKWEPGIGKVRVQWIGPHRKNRLTS